MPRQLMLFPILIAILLTASRLSAAAEGQLLQVQTRATQTISYWWQPAAQSNATVLLFSGGSGGMGYQNGQPQSANFLVRSRQLFVDAGLNVAIIGNPSDRRSIDEYWRISAEHMSDIQNVLQDIRQRSAAPVWLVGTSMGTISAASAAIQLPQLFQGVVLTSGITNSSASAALPRLALEKIQIPALVLHHHDDACKKTPAAGAQRVIDKISSPRKKIMIVSGGANPSGDPCEALHWHGFIGMEAEVVQDISQWISQPQP